MQETLWYVGMGAPKYFACTSIKQDFMQSRIEIDRIYIYRSMRIGQLSQLIIRH